MAEGRGRLEWSQTSELLASQFNANRGKQQARTGKDFNPYFAKPNVVRISKKEGFAMLRGIFRKST